MTDFDNRRDPDAILRQIKDAQEREENVHGRLKVFFGYAAGVGKTFAMLEEAHTWRDRGYDVVVGYLEPHARAETLALLDGLEQLPTKTVSHKAIELREFDIDAALERRPQIILVDELAHTNAPDSRHKKRYQDIEELLRAGINVFTTVNVQHLEGLNDKIASITQVSVSERIPDFVFDRADLVELIDIEPDDLIERLNSGKIYVAERSRTALSNFFTKKNLAALREVALRRMADRMTRNVDLSDAASHVEAGEDVLVYITPDAGNVKVIRAAANMAEAFHGALTALVVESSGGKQLDEEESVRLQANIDLAEELGAHVVTVHGEDIAVLISQYSVTAGITQLVLGSSMSSKSIFRKRSSLVSRLTKLSYGAIINVVPVEDMPARLSRTLPSAGLKLTTGDVLTALAAVALATAVSMVVFEFGLSASVILMLYMLVALLFATRADGFIYALLVALGSMLAFNFFFTTPRFTFNAYGLNYPFIFAFLMLSTVLASSLTIKMKRQTQATARRAYRTEVLLESSRKLQAATTMIECFDTTAAQIMKILDRPVVMYRLDADARLMPPTVYDVPGSGGGDASAKELIAPSEAAVAAWVATNNERAGATTDTLRDARCLYLPIRSKDTVYGVAGLVLGEDSEDFGALEKNLLVAILDECGQASEQISFAFEHHQMRMKIEKEALRSNLLRTISHDLRTPLTSISGDADMLISEGEKLTAEQKQQMYQDIYEDSSWLIDLVENLLSVTRIDDGTVNIETQPELISDVVENAMRHVTRKAESHNIKVDLSDEFLLVNMDARLIMQVIINLVNNAVAYTPENSHIVVAAKKRREAGKDVVRLTVTDDGPGILDADKKRIFDMFYHVELTEKSGKLGDSRRGMGLGLALCRSIVNVHGSEIDVRDVDPHGCEFGFDLPVAKMGTLTSGMHDEDSEHKGA